MILSSSPLGNSLLPKVASGHEHYPEASASTESLDLSRSLLLVAGHSLSALGLQLALHQRRNNDDYRAHHLEHFPGVAELLELLRSTRDPQDRGQYLHTAIWRLARGLPHATVHLTGFEGIPLDDLDYAEAILHAAREGLRSAARCNADRVWLRLRQNRDWLHLELEDNGMHYNGRSDHRLNGLRTRLSTLAGEVQVDDRRNDGWKLVIRLPRVNLQP